MHGCTHSDTHYLKEVLGLPEEAEFLLCNLSFCLFRSDASSLIFSFSPKRSSILRSSTWILSSFMLRLWEYASLNLLSSSCICLHTSWESSHICSQTEVWAYIYTTYLACLCSCSVTSALLLLGMLDCKLPTWDFSLCNSWTVHVYRVYDMHKSASWTLDLAPTNQDLLK